jgi:hypothetical protein
LVINQNKIDIIEEKKGDLSRLQIKVNDQTIGTTEDAKLINSPMDLYYGWIGYLNVTDKETGKIETVIVQRMDPAINNPIGYQNKEWTLYRIDENKKIQIEHIKRDDRGSHSAISIKEIMIGGTSLDGIGYKSDLRYIYPSLLFPLLFPYGFFCIGLLIIGLSLLDKLLKKPAKL